MAESDISRFFDALAENDELVAEYNAAVREALWPVISEVAAKHGLRFSPEELGQWLEQKQAELSDEMLDGVAGGIAAGPTSPARMTPTGIVGGLAVLGAALDTGDDDDQRSRPVSP